MLFSPNFPMPLSAALTKVFPRCCMMPGTDWKGDRAENLLVCANAVKCWLLTRRKCWCEHVYYCLLSIQACLPVDVIALHVMKRIILFFTVCVEYENLKLNGTSVILCYSASYASSGWYASSFTSVGHYGKIATKMGRNHWCKPLVGHQNIFNWDHSKHQSQAFASAMVK